MAKITAKPGDIIKRPPNGNNILGFLIIIGTSYDDVRETLERFADQIDVKMVDQPPTKSKTPWKPQDTLDTPVPA
jgi:hypothetical protein